MEQTITIALIIVSVSIAQQLFERLFPLREGAATSPATLIQLASSSVEDDIPGPGWAASHVPAGPVMPQHRLRPVKQRGMFFGNPSWHR